MRAFIAPLDPHSAKILAIRCADPNMYRGGTPCVVWLNLFGCLGASCLCDCL